MKKILIALIAVLFLGTLGFCYVTGRLDGAIARIIGQQEMPDSPIEAQDFPKVLERVRSAMGEVKSVKSTMTGGEWSSEKADGSPGSYEEWKDERIEKYSYPDSKEFPADGYNVIVKDGYIYKEMPMITQVIAAQNGSPLQYEGLSFTSGWFRGTDGQSVPFMLQDGVIEYDMKDFPDGWDFTRNVEEITQDLGTEEINGISCRHYKVKVEDRSLEEIKAGLDKDAAYLREHILMVPFAGDSLELGEGKEIRYEQGVGLKVKLGEKGFLIPIPEDLAYPDMHSNVGITGSLDRPSELSYELYTWGIDGEIWVGESDYRIYKESYTTEKSSSYCNPDESKGEDRGIIETRSYIDRKKHDIVYSDFDSDMGITAPDKFMTADEILKASGYESSEAYKQTIAEAEIVSKRNERRAITLSEIADALDDYAVARVKGFSAPPYYPSTGNKTEKIDSESSIDWRSILGKELPKDPRDPEYYYTYKSDGVDFILAARMENEEHCQTENGICLYKIDSHTTYQSWKYN